MIKRITVSGAPALFLAAAAAAAGPAPPPSASTDTAPWAHLPVPPPLATPVTPATPASQALAEPGACEACGVAG